MVFYLIGLGLGGPEDITVKGLKIVKSASKVYLEAYTSILTCGKEILVNSRLNRFIPNELHQMLCNLRYLTNLLNNLDTENI